MVENPLYLQEIGMGKDANFKDDFNKPIFELLYLKTL